MRIPVARNIRQALAFYPVETVRAMDAAAIEQLGPDGGYELMQRAGQGAFEYLRQRWPALGSVGVLCGGGNNGGDGYVVARLAHGAGLRVTCWTLADLTSLRGSAAQAWQDAVAAGVKIEPVQSSLPESVDVWVDAMVGTGFRGVPTEQLKACIETLNRSGRPVFALDVPSGLNADTGAAAGVAVQATATLTFIGLKGGLLTGKGVSHCGDLWLDDLSVPRELLETFPKKGQVLGIGQPEQRLAPRARDAHKGAFGRVLVVGGDYGFGGAAILAAGSAARAGAGGVVCGTRDGHIQPGLSCFPDVMFHALGSREELIGLIGCVSALALGPGLGQGPWGQMGYQVARTSGLPCVLDADALNLLARDDRPGEWCGERVLTPHPGEAARLMGCTIAEIETDRYAAAAALADQYGAVCLLKGAGTVIAGPVAADGSRELATLVAGNPGMATAGMGDVLTGIIGSLLAQGLPPFGAASLGAAWHAASGDHCRQQKGEASLMAMDVSAALGQVMAEAGV